MTLALASVPTQAEAALAQIQDLRAQLADVTDFTEAHQVVTRADALREWVRIARVHGEAAFEAGELLLRSQRKAGLLLLEFIQDAGPTRGHSGPQPRKTLPRGSHQDLGLTTRQSSIWQLLARLPADEFDQRIEACREAERVPSTESFLRAARRFVRPRPIHRRQTLGLLRRAVTSMREVRVIKTPAEYAVAKEIARLGAGWLAVMDEQERQQRETSRSTRVTSCLLCGRGQPAGNPPKCPTCGGSWYVA